MRLHLVYKLFLAIACITACVLGVSSTAQALIVNVPVHPRPQPPAQDDPTDWPQVGDCTWSKVKKMRSSSGQRAPIGESWFTGQKKVEYRSRYSRWSKRAYGFDRQGRVTMYKLSRWHYFQGQAYYRVWPWEKSWWHGWKTLCSQVEDAYQRV